MNATPACSTLLALLATPGAAFAQTTPLNPPFDLVQKVGEVDDFRTHAGLSEVLFRVEARDPGLFELYRAPLDGGRRSLPVVALGPEERILDYQLSPDGQWVAFVADLDEREVFELYAHRVGTPGSRRLSVVGPAGDVQSFQFAGDRLVYLETAAQDGPARLHSVPLDGSSTPVRLDGTSGGQAVHEFALALASARVVFSADGPVRTGLFSVPLAGGVRVPLDAGVSSDHEVGGSLEVAPGGTFVLFRAFPASGGVGATRVYRADVDGLTSAVRLDGGLGTSSVPALFAAAGGTRALFSAETTAGLEVFSVDVDGLAAPERLNPVLGPNEDADYVQLTPDGMRAVFSVRNGATLRSRLYSARVEGVGGPLLLEQDLPSTLGWLTLSPDSARAVYFLFVDNEIHSVPLDGSAPAVRLDDEAGGVAVPTPVGPFSGGPPLVISPDSSTVLFAFGQPFQPNFEGQGLHRAPIDGSAPQVAVQASHVAYGFDFDASGSHILFRAEGTGLRSQKLELFSAPATGGAPVLLSDRLALGSSERVYLDGDAEPAFVRGAGADFVFALDGAALWRNRADGTTAATSLANGIGALEELRVTPDRTRLVFQCSTGNSTSLWSLSTTDPSAAPVQVASGAQGGIQGDFELTQDGQFVVYRRQTATGGSLEVTPITAQAPLVLAAERAVFFRLAPGNSRVLYRPATALAEIKSVPLDGSAAPLSLGQAPVMLLGAFAPDGQRACLVRANSSQGPWELSLVTVDGSSAPMLLHAAAEPQAALFEPSGAFVLFAAAGSLLRAPADGSAAPVVLASVASPTLVDFTPDGASLVYISSGDLYRVRLDGSSAALSLSGGQTGAGVRVSPRVDVAFTPDGQAVLYVSERLPLRGHQLWLASLASGARQLLSGELVLEGDVLGAGLEPAFRITPDGAAVVYRADAELDGMFDLYLASLSGSFRPLRLDPPLARPGVTFFELSSDGRHVVYQGDEVRFSTELFSTRLPRIPQDRHAQRR